MSGKKESEGLVASNRKAFHEYFILEKMEAGMSLYGTEVKSLRDGRINLKDSFARIEQGQVYLYNCHISPYSHGNLANHEPTRRRKLLMRKREIERFTGKTREKGLTLIPLKVYFKGGWAKVELGLAKGKHLYDKRETAAKKSAQREMERAVRGRSRF
ncbi:MAG: SsrA-binding protein SmpB [Nitrospiria bacterium]